VVDVSDPTTPTLDSIHDFSTDVNSFPARGMAIDGDHIYVGTGSFSGLGGGFIKVWDISTRDSPTLVGSVSGVGSIEFRALESPGDGYLYASTWPAPSGGVGSLRIYDISTPSTPSQVGVVSLGASSAVADGRFHVDVANGLVLLLGATGITTTAYLIDISNKTAPSVITSRTNSSANLEISPISPDGTHGWLYGLGSSNIIGTVDLSASGLTTVATINPAPYVGRAAMWDPNGYIIHPGRGVYDVRDPTAPADAAAASGTGPWYADWALDYHSGRRLTASGDTTRRMSIGLVNGITQPGGWSVGVLSMS
jgi:hypothetical protein